MYMHFIFLRATAYAIARICYRPSVRLSVCLSVTRVYHRTRSQAVARIADRTASQHIWGSGYVIGHVTIW